MHIQVSLIVDIDATADLSTMEHQIQEAGHCSMREALRQGIRAWGNHHRTCLQCGSSQVRLEGTVSRTIQALFGSVHLGRQRIRCQTYFHRFCPAQALLEPLQRERVSSALAEAACLAGSSWPYRHAAQVLARLSGAQVSAEEIRLLTNARGREVAKEQEQEQQVPAASDGQQTKPDSSSTDRTIIGLDGGWVPNRQRRGGQSDRGGEPQSCDERTLATLWQHELDRVGTLCAASSAIPSSLDRDGRCAATRPPSPRPL